MGIATRIRAGRVFTLDRMRVIALLAVPILLSTAASAGKSIARDVSDSESFAVRLSPAGNESQFVAVNPIHGLRAAFSHEQVRVTPLAPTGSWEFGLRLTGFGAANDVKPVAEPTIDSAGDRVTLLREKVTEWYVNERRGLEHGFTLRESPGGSTVHVDLEWTGNLDASLGGDGSWIDFTPRGGLFNVLRYSGLLVADAEGRELAARFELDGSRIRIAFDATGAVWPVKIDPMLTSPAWSSEELDDSSSIAWGDWDRDGDLDLAVGNSNEPNRIYENTDGLLDLVWSSSETTPTSSVAWGDWDGDGDLDLAFGNIDGSNEVYENLGKWFRLAWSSDEADHTRAVAWGDWDGDGDLDLAAGNLDQPNRVYENSGGDLELGWSSDESDATTSLAWGDLESDDALDLIVGNYGQPNRIYRNLATGLTLWWSSAETDRTNSVAIGDWDRDSKLDLAFGNEGEPARLYKGAGNSVILDWSSAEIDDTTGVALGDLDADGDLDLAVSNIGQPNRVYENVAGVFELTWSSEQLEETRGLALGDCDGDGDLDLAVANRGAANRVAVGHPGFLKESWSGPFPQLTKSVAWGDWDYDGDLDLAVGNEDQAFNGFVGGVEVYRNRNETLQLVWSSPQRDRTWSVAWGDWDGDGDLDLAAGNFGQPNRIYEFRNFSLFLAWTSEETNLTASVAWADWDGDGDLDLAVGNTNEPNQVYENTGNHQMELAWTSEDSEATTEVAWGDWDGDGRLDLAVGNSGQSRLYENTGGALELIWTSPASDGTSSIAWGDWDGDGDLDLATGNFALPNLVYENTGKTLALAWSSDESDDTTNVVWGDWDGDGDLDLAVGNLWLFMKMYENTGGNLEIMQEAGEWDALLSQVAFADVDLDGDLDLAAGNRCPVIVNRVYGNHRLDKTGTLPDAPVRPVTVRRPGNTASAFYFSSAERLDESPVMIPYNLVDPQGDRAWRIDAEYSLTGGGGWLPATEGPGGSGTSDLAAGPGAGVEHFFSWDARTDGACSDGVTFRITVRYQAPGVAGGPIQMASLSSATPPFRVGPRVITRYGDADGDGHGDPLATERSCWPLPGFVENANDCDPSNGRIYPGAPEIADGLDNQCPGDPGHGQIDEQPLFKPGN